MAATATVVAGAGAASRAGAAAAPAAAEPVIGASVARLACCNDGREAVATAATAATFAKGAATGAKKGVDGNVRRKGTHALETNNTGV